MPKATPPPSTPDDEHESDAAIGKGHPTPKRSAQQAARRRPLVANTKEAKQQASAELRARREEARMGMAAGEDKFLPPRDKGPQRKFLRDWVDSRWHVAEWVMPAMLIVIVASFVGIPAVQVYSFFALWVFILVAILGMVLTGINAKKAVARKFGESRVERGTKWYAAMRSMQMRFMRLPKPQVRRGQRPE